MMFIIYKLYVKIIVLISNFFLWEFYNLYLMNLRKYLNVINNYWRLRNNDL